MAIRITCPGCETSLTLGDDKRGKKVRCKSCEKVLSIPSANGKARTKQADPDEDEDEDEEETEDQAAEEEPSKKSKPAADEKSEVKKDEKSRKKKKKKKGGGIEVPWFWIGLGAVALLILLIPGVGVLLWRPWEEPERKAAQNNAAAPPRMPMMPEGNNPIGGNVVKNPKTLIGQIRARGDQIERDALMSGFVPLYNAYCDEVKNPGARNLDGFLVSIKSESAKLVNAVKNKDFIINFKARVESDEILAFEPEMYTQGYYCIRANKAFEYVTAEQLKAAGLEVPAAPAGP